MAVANINSKSEEPTQENRRTNHTPSKSITIFTRIICSRLDSTRIITIITVADKPRAPARAT